MKAVSTDQTIGNRERPVQRFQEVVVLVNEDVIRVKTRIGSESPVAGTADVDRRHGAPLFIKEAGWHVVAQGWWRCKVAHEREHHAVDLPHRVAVQATLADQSAVRRAGNRNQFAILEVVGEGVQPAGDRVFGVALGPRREPEAAVQALVGNRIDHAIDALEQQVLAQQRDRHQLLLANLRR